jgi:hypothetical protein
MFVSEERKYPENSEEYIKKVSQFFFSELLFMQKNSEREKAEGRNRQ